jgi:hypothetical protein
MCKPKEGASQVNWGAMCTPVKNGRLDKAAPFLWRSCAPSVALTCGSLLLESTRLLTQEIKHNLIEFAGLLHIGQVGNPRDDDLSCAFDTCR